MLGSHDARHSSRHIRSGQSQAASLHCQGRCVQAARWLSRSEAWRIHNVVLCSFRDERGCYVQNTRAMASEQQRERGREGAARCRKKTGNAILECEARESCELEASDGEAAATPKQQGQQRRLVLLLIQIIVMHRIVRLLRAGCVGRQMLVHDGRRRSKDGSNGVAH